VHANLERSYVAYPFGITGLEPLIFEADLGAELLDPAAVLACCAVSPPRIIL
jgi:hypothetical protein